MLLLCFLQIMEVESVFDTFAVYILRYMDSLVVVVDSVVSSLCFKASGRCGV